MHSIRTLSLVLSLVLAPLAAGGTLLVPAQYPTIQAAIDAAQSGDTVSVAPGTYLEHGLILKDGVDLKGAGWKTTVIDAEAQPTYNVRAVGSFVIEGLTLRNTGVNGQNHGIHVLQGSASSNGTIRDCRLEQNTGINIDSTYLGTIAIERNQIVNLLAFGFGVRLSYPGNGPAAVNVRNNTITSCTYGYYDKVYNGAVTSGFEVLLENNIIALNDHGVRSDVYTPITVQYNDVHDNTNGDFYQHGVQSQNPAGSSWNPSPTNFSADPMFHDSYPFNVNLKVSSPCIDAGNPATFDPDNSIADVGALWYDATYAPALAEPFGAGCGGLQLTTTGVPLAGSVGEFELGFSGAPLPTMVFLLVGLSGATWGGLTLPYDFGAAAPGCQLLAAPMLVVDVYTFGSGWPGATGALTIPLALPNDAASMGVPLDLQWAAAAPGANPLGFVFSEGLHLTIGE